MYTRRLSRIRTLYRPFVSEGNTFADFTMNDVLTKNHFAEMFGPRLATAQQDKVNLFPRKLELADPSAALASDKLVDYHLFI